jgi:hypothetical protein
VLNFFLCIYIYIRLTFHPNCDIFVCNFILLVACFEPTPLVHRNTSALIIMMNQLTPSTNVARYSFSINHTIYLTHWIPNGHYVVLMYFLYTSEKSWYFFNIKIYNIVSNISCRFLCKIKMQYLPLFLLFFLYKYT